MTQLDQPWFDMDDLRRPRIASSSWIPLRSQQTRERGQYWKLGCIEEYIGAVSIILPAQAREQALQFQWGEADRHDDRPWIEDETYYRAGTFTDYQSDLVGNYPILVQRRDADHQTEWHLDQDLLFALALKREGDVWVCPAEDYLEVVRLKRAPDGDPELIEIRAEQLRDYLCARNAGLLVATYRSRRSVFADHPKFTWESCNPRRDVEGGRWEGRINDIDETGSPYGSGVGVFMAWRKDPELGDDIPVLGSPSDENTESSSKTFTRTDQRLVFVSGEMWRNEWVEPGPQSPRVRRDRVEPSIPFLIANDGTRATARELKGTTRWLWFSPSIVGEILRRRGGFLGWYTEDTGSLKLPSHSALHFGVNNEGWINIFAKDIAMLPEAAQKLWAAHNISPEGGVSRELLASQMECNPASTVVPEVDFVKAVEELERASTDRFGKSLLRAHESEEQVLSSVHRFQCLDFKGIYHLCKEITRAVIERIDVDLLKKVRPGDENKLGSLKRLERLVSEYGADGRQPLGPLVGAYDLRLADARLPTSDFSRALELLGVRDDRKYIHMGKQIIRNVAQALAQITSIIRTGNTNE
jgi:hypothetical protein